MGVSEAVVGLVDISPQGAATAALSGTGSAGMRVRLRAVCLVSAAYCGLTTIRQVFLQNRIELFVFLPYGRDWTALTYQVFSGRWRYSRRSPSVDSTTVVFASSTFLNDSIDLMNW